MQSWLKGENRYSLILFSFKLFINYYHNFKIPIFHLNHNLSLFVSSYFASSFFFLSLTFSFAYFSSPGRFYNGFLFDRFLFPLPFLIQSSCSKALLPTKGEITHDLKSKTDFRFLSWPFLMSIEQD